MAMWLDDQTYHSIGVVCLFQQIAQFAAVQFLQI
jgi:hypothetical protein